MNIAPADTRRAFMESIYESFSLEQKLWLESQLGPHISVKDYIRNLLIKNFLNNKETISDK